MTSRVVGRMIPFVEEVIAKPDMWSIPSRAGSCRVMLYGVGHDPGLRCVLMKIPVPTAPWPVAA